MARRDDQVANVIMAQFLHLDAEDPEQDIHLYINSPGGSGSAMLAMYDTMQFVSADVATTALGMAASAGRSCSRRGPGQEERAAQHAHPDTPAVHTGSRRAGLRRGDPRA